MHIYPTISHLLLCFSDEKDEPKTLEPGDYQLYTWENPMGKRELTWNSGEAKNKKDTLVKVKYFCAARKWENFDHKWVHTANPPMRSFWRNFATFFFQDNIGEFFYDSKNDVHVYWVSFLDGMQRVLLFTEDVALATVAQQVSNSSSVRLNWSV